MHKKQANRYRIEYNEELLYKQRKNIADANKIIKKFICVANLKTINILR